MPDSPDETPRQGGLSPKIPMPTPPQPPGGNK